VEQLRQMCAVLAAGLCGGFLGFGLGGRLMMRLLAATSPDATGRETDAGEIVGEVTTGGTVFLVVFLTVMGLVGALVVHAARPLLPANSLAAGAVVGAIGGGILIGPTGLLNPDNADFEILEPTWLAVVLCVATIAVGALTTAVLLDRWVARWPAPALSIRGVAGLAPLVACIVSADRCGRGGHRRHSDLAGGSIVLAAGRSCGPGPGGLRCCGRNPLDGRQRSGDSGVTVGMVDMRSADATRRGSQRGRAGEDGPDG
jgi:hypothetical protein